MEVLNKYKSGLPEGSVYIGRGTVFGNPYLLNTDGDRETVVEKFRIYLAKQMLSANSELQKAILGLKQTDRLVCFCKPKACHGDIIREVFEMIAQLGLDKTLEIMKTWIPEEKHFTPLEDGATHINVYSGGNTKIGRWLSNFQYAPFNHPEHGNFDSVEGYWYWLKTGTKHDELRTIFGFEAKKLGKTFEVVNHPYFRSNVCQAIFSKIMTNEKAKEKIKETTLPFVHYYYFGNMHEAKVKLVPTADWQMQFLERVRLYLQGKASKTLIAGSRTITELNAVKTALDNSGFTPVEIVSGTAKGVDRLGEQLAESIPVAIRRFPADWDGPYKKAAGVIRNSQMEAYCENAIIIHDGVSTGTLDMKAKIEKANKPLHYEVYPS